MGPFPSPCAGRRARAGRSELWRPLARVRALRLWRARVAAGSRTLQDCGGLRLATDLAACGPQSGGVASGAPYSALVSPSALPTASLGLLLGLVPPLGLRPFPVVRLPDRLRLAPSSFGLRPITMLRPVGLSRRRRGRLSFGRPAGSPPVVASASVGARNRGDGVEGGREAKVPSVSPTCGSGTLRSPAWPWAGCRARP